MAKTSTKSEKTKVIEKVAQIKETPKKPLPSKTKVEVKAVPSKKAESKKVEVKPAPAKKVEAKKVEVKPTPSKKAESKKSEDKLAKNKLKNIESEITNQEEKFAEISESVPEKHNHKATPKTTYPEKINFRLSQIYFHLYNEKVEGIYISYLPNIKYLTGFTGSQADLFIFKDSIHFFTDDRYEEQIKTELYPLPNLTTHITRDLWQTVNQIGLLESVDAIAFESDRVSYYDAVEFRNYIRPCKFKPAPNLVEPFTTSKAAEEIDYIKQACKIAEEVYEDILKFIQPGMTEKEIANEISYLGRKKGAEGESFDIIVTSGYRGAIIHGQPSDKKIRKGDIVLMDFGFKIKGFSSDISRTICVGAKPTREQKHLYSVLREAEQKAIDAVLPGMNGKTLDAIVRKVINEAGYENIAYQHSLGHGIGIVTHEKPFLTFRRDDQIVPDDSVLAIEPGAYIPDKYGMRVEDNIYVTKNGAIMLTTAPLELPYIL